MPPDRGGTGAARPCDGRVARARTSIGVAHVHCKARLGPAARAHSAGRSNRRQRCNGQRLVRARRPAGAGIAGADRAPSGRTRASGLRWRRKARRHSGRSCPAGHPAIRRAQGSCSSRTSLVTSFSSSHTALASARSVSGGKTRRSAARACRKLERASSWSAASHNSDARKSRGRWHAGPQRKTAEQRLALAGRDRNLGSVMSPHADSADQVDPYTRHAVTPAVLVGSVGPARPFSRFFHGCRHGAFTCRR